MQRRVYVTHLDKCFRLKHYKYVQKFMYLQPKTIVHAFSFVKLHSNVLALVLIL